MESSISNQILFNHIPDGKTLSNCYKKFPWRLGRWRHPQLVRSKFLTFLYLAEGKGTKDLLTADELGGHGRFPCAPGLQDDRPKGLKIRESSENTVAQCLDMYGLLTVIGLGTSISK